MSRRIRLLVALALVTFSFAASACANSSTGPRPAFKQCDTSSTQVC
jgi:hypothetical protein